MLETEKMKSHSRELEVGMLTEHNLDIGWFSQTTLTITLFGSDSNLFMKF